MCVFFLFFSISRSSFFLLSFISFILSFFPSCWVVVFFFFYIQKYFFQLSVSFLFSSSYSYLCNAADWACECASYADVCNEWFAFLFARLTSTVCVQCNALSASYTAIALVLTVVYWVSNIRIRRDVTMKTRNRKEKKNNQKKNTQENLTRLTHCPKIDFKMHLLGTSGFATP